MLLDYAAQIKCRTSRRVASTAVALTHLPSDVRSFIVHFSSHAQRLLVQLHAELVAITTGAQYQESVKSNLSRTRQQLRKATQLIEKGKRVIDRVSDDVDDSHQRDADDESTLSQPTDDDSDNSDTLSVKTDDSDDAKDSGGIDASSIDLLQEQIRQLKEQMERFAQLQTAAAAGHHDDGVARGEDGEEDVPMAPPLSQSMYPSIPIASPMLPNNIPTAPPMTVPCAPPLAPPMAPPIATPLIPTAPTLCPDVPIAPPLIPAAPPLLSSPASPCPSPSSSALRPILSDVTRLRANQPTLPTIYTRNIPGSDVLSHTDLIQVAARIKLRRTEVPRSPGGTPYKKAAGVAGGGGSIGEALRMKFRNVNGSRAGLRGSTSYGGGDKENESWATD